MSAPQKIPELVDLFRRNADAYHSPNYKEAEVRIQFINPLFKCLGWDIDNEQGYAEAYKDVIHEAAIKIGGANHLHYDPGTAARSYDTILPKGGSNERTSSDRSPAGRCT
jgi:hypothetical protein